jgi:hypothetical protein
MISEVLPLTGNKKGTNVGNRMKPYWSGDDKEGGRKYRRTEYVG